MLGQPKTQFVALLLCGALLNSPAARGQSSKAPAPGPATAPSKEIAKRARRAFSQAQQAEKDEDWQAAFALYSEAAELLPGNGEYLMKRETARFRLVREHVDRAERAAVAERLEEARAELRAALALDPSYTVAQERLQQFEPRLTQRVEQPSYPSRPAEVMPLPGARSFDFRGDTRAAYGEVARQFGLTAAFDEDMRPQQVRFRVEDVNFPTAMHLLGRQTGTFWRAVDEHTFLVAPDNPQKRRELEPSVVRTVTLSNLATPEQMTEMVRLVREIAGVRRTQLDMRARALTMRDSPESVDLAVKIIENLEQPVGEMMLEIEILDVNRNAAQRLGIMPPTSARTFTVSPEDIRQAQQSPAALLQVLQRVFGTPTTFTGQSSLGALIPPLVAFGGGKSIFLATLPGAAADFADIFSTLRQAQRLLLRAQDGQPVTFFSGERFPVAVAVLQPNLVSPLAAAVEQASFPRSNLSAAERPISIVAADFNGDGRMDLAVANATANSVSIFLGNGDGTFGARADIPVGVSPSSITVADFNADGHPDLAVANAGSNSVSILLGKGDGTFTQKADIATGTAPSAVIAGDLNGDGRTDLAVANSGSNTVSIFLGHGDGTFEQKPDLATGANPRALVMGRFNADAFLDLAVVNQDANTVSVFLGNGDGTFGPRTDYATGNAPLGIAAADFNGDNQLDLAVVNRDSNSVSILLGNGDGSFRARTDFAVGDSPAAVVTGDFNADGHTDLITANSKANAVTVLLGTGDGGFGLRADLNTGSGPAALAAADFNGDGRIDLAVANHDDNTVSVILNQTPIVPPSAISTSLAATPYPGFQYEDLGVKVRATPRLHSNGEVTLHLRFEIRSLAGQAINQIPILSNRTVEETVRLRENETTLLTGILERTEQLAITGWPGFAGTPGVGPLASSRNPQRQETELLIFITPRRIRLAPRLGRSIYAGFGGEGEKSGAAAQPPP